MTLIFFQHSVKYMYLQMAPYVALTIVTGYMATGPNILWFFAYLAMAVILACRMFVLTSAQYFFTHDMLIVSRGLVFRKVECRALWQLKGMELRQNCLLRKLAISHIHYGLEGPPADRIRLIDIDNRMMVKILDQLKEGIDLNTEMWREHFKAVTS